ncbi:MAG: hypothetical protein J5I94_27900 [Phaeodactylibacter sp.]|nr:hypothetical protein [Phaeodactylibacter sp.]
MNYITCTLLAFLLSVMAMPAHGQSLELMAGHKRIFADAQWLNFMDAGNRYSIFSRTRATVDYDNNTDLFTGAYLNYTSRIGIGASIVGKIASGGAGADAGIHIFKAKPTWMLFGLASVGLKSELEYSWFSIFRYTPPLGGQWKLYSSLELFSLFRKGGHLASVQRIRLGLDHRGFQFGAAVNLAETGREWAGASNIGGFLRRAF